MVHYDLGMTVRYKPVGGPESESESVGKITDIMTEPGKQAGHDVNASMENPSYEIENLSTHKMTTVYEKNILGIEETLTDMPKKTW
ncbi:hypothetical protein QBC37DRAFT_416904 [Rhypophila decipiens]|uniref:Hypervirulence associated protein TUDOR domain-containing protein n=1 Tax=Rhypophila decipiens TaxID=261697 RepID=A0AAN7B8E8_9PEZI|nr:hypothetical protein QBC37DRAFT_416904 [Rhypophila decipiens]